MKPLLWRRTNREDANGLAPLYLRITILGQRAEYETAVCVAAAYWPAGTKEIVLPADKKARRPDFPGSRLDELNSELRALVAKADRIYKDLRALKRECTAKIVRDALPYEWPPEDVPVAEPEPERVILTVKALADLFYVTTEAMPAEVRKSPNTLQNYRSRIANINRWLTEGLQRPDLPASEVSKPLCRQFERWCLGNGFGAASMRKQINMLQMVISHGVHEELLAEDRIHGYKYQTDLVKKVPVYLPLADVVRLRVVEFTDEAMNRAVAGWLFCCATGLSWVDYCRFARTPAAFLHTDEDGQQWIRMVRQKMIRRKPWGFSVPLFPEARAILDAWRRLPYSVNRNANEQLLKVEKALGLTKRLSTKLARSTFSQLRRDEGYSDEVVAAWMGDSVEVMNSHYSQISEARSKLEMQAVAERPVRKLIPISEARATGTDGL